LKNAFLRSIFWFLLISKGDLMIQPRKSQERGHANHGWLDSHHTFSFGSYQDKRFTGFRDLLVINEDRVVAGKGFGRHSHEDMEIISYVLEGALEHKDSLGTGSVLRPGDVQRMSAGTGVEHSEFNHSKTEGVHFLQIWLTPTRDGLEPSYEEKRFSETEKKNRLRLVVSPDGKDGSLRMNQESSLYASILEKGKELSHSLAPGRHAWIQVARGSLSVNGIQLSIGDGASVTDETSLSLLANEDSEFLLFDLV
jgi:quercetin 2,3-dioxygenase